MILEASDLADGDVRRTDVCIIGGGGAGITLALELRDTGLDAVLLEGGGLDYEPESAALYDGEQVGAVFGAPDAPVSLRDVRLRFFGGTTNHWAGYCRPQEEHTVRGHPHRPRSGWPIAYDELGRWYAHVAPRFRIDTLAFDWETWADRLGLGTPLFTDGGYTTRVNQYRPIRFGPTFRPDLAAAGSVEVILHANATEILVDDNSDAVRGVSVAVLDGPRFIVQARAVVVAVGGIENPRLLLASNSVRTAGLGNERDLVGRHFCEHPQADIGLVILDRPPDQLALYDQTPLPDADFFGVTSYLVADDDVIDREELLGFDAGLLPLHWPDEPQGDGLAASAVAQLTELIGAAPTQSISVLRALPEQELNPESRVRLGGERDALGVPELELDWRFLDIDRRSMMTHARHLAREIGRRGLGRVQLVPGALRFAEERRDDDSYLGLFTLDPAAADETDFALGYGNHHMCTTRMATSPADGVVDTDCRVHGLANLYVAGSSVFPVAGTAPPTFTIAALAARLAAHLVAELRP